MDYIRYTSRHLHLSIEENKFHHRQISQGRTHLKIRQFSRAVCHPKEMIRKVRVPYLNNEMLL